MSEKKSAQIKVQFNSEAEAKDWLDAIKQKAAFLVTQSIDVVKNTIIIVYTAAANVLLLQYGKFKDNLPYSLFGSSSYGPVGS